MVNNDIQRIVQFGSGKPGELGTEATEQKLFAELKLDNPLVGFIPFHYLQHKEEHNDWKLFQRIMSDISTKKPLLFELQKRRDVHRLKKELFQLDALVLGAGFVEPYLRLIHTNQLLAPLQNFFYLGGVLIGYSAGSCALSALNVNAISWDQIFENYAEMVQTNHPKKQVYHLMALSFCTKENINTVQTTLSQIESNDADWRESPLCQEVSQVYFRKALNFVSASALYPHYQEHAMGMPWHLKKASQLRVNIKHVGIPNGVCLMHSYDKGTVINRQFIGQHPNENIKAEVWQQGEKINLDSFVHTKH